MVSATVLFIFSVASVCGKAAAEKKLVYVTVVSNIINIWCLSMDSVSNSIAVLLGFPLV